MSEVLTESERLGRKLNYQGQKRLARRLSLRDAHRFVHGHEDLILGASTREIDTAVKKIAKALRDLRVAKIDAEKAKREELDVCQK